MTAADQSRTRRWLCPACGLGLRPDDSVVVVTMRPFHASCAEASFGDAACSGRADHADQVDQAYHADRVALGQWARGLAWDGGRTSRLS